MPFIDWNMLDSKLYLPWFSYLMGSSVWVTITLLSQVPAIGQSEEPLLFISVLFIFCYGGGRLGGWANWRLTKHIYRSEPGFQVITAVVWLVVLVVPTALNIVPRYSLLTPIGWVIAFITIFSVVITRYIRELIYQNSPRP